MTGGLARPILDFVPSGWTLMSHQRKLLLEYERVPAYVKNVMLRVPVAGGKTLLAYVIASYEAARRGGPSTILSRDNTLVAQYRDSLGGLVRLAPYRGHMGERDWEQAKHDYDAEPVRVSNFFSHLSLKSYPKCLLIDEMHQTSGVLADMESVKLWRHLCPWPDGMWRFDQILAWLTHEAAQAEARGEYTKALRLIRKDPSNITFEFGAGEYRGKESEYLKILPLTPKNNAPIMWPPRRVERIVGLSATIATDDLIDIGIDKLPTRWLECDSPIPAANRPCIYEPFGDMSHGKWKQELGRMVLGIDYLAARHNTERGLIHTTYNMASALANALHQVSCGTRIITHTQWNKAAKFREWQQTERAIFIASGMAEGIDLAYDKARWQIISKIVWPNKTDRAVEAKMSLPERADWYGWETLKLVMQQYGRVCRRPDDYGVTYICDVQFEKLLKSTGHLMTDWFKQALQ